MREAANASQLRRNFAGSTLLAVPEMHWELCSQRVIVMERMLGVPISQKSVLEKHGVDIKALARAGVEIFFTQVFRDGFFHADMHPGNIFVSVDGETKGRYVALDFGIMGTLSDVDKSYLARWMNEQVGWRALLRTLKNEAPYWATTLPELPRLLHRALAEDRLGELRDSVNRLADESARRNNLTAFVAALLAVALLVALISLW